MAFDPDQYLAERTSTRAPSSGGFDPDAYLAKAKGDSAPYSDDSNHAINALKSAGKFGLGALNTAARTIDRFTGAPTRAAIGAAQNADSLGAIIPDAVSAGAHQFGADPDKAPSGEDIVKRAGVPDGMASKALGFGMDMAANPLTLMEAPGIAGKVPAMFGKAADAAAPYLSKGVAKASELATGVPSEAVERLIQRPTQVMGAEDEGNALKVAGNARNELLTRDAAEDQAISQARKTFRENFGENQVDTSPILDSHSEFMGNNAPSSTGKGPLSPQEFKQLSALEKKELLTKTLGDSQDPNAVYSRPVFSKDSEVLKPEVQFTPLKETNLKYGTPDTQTLDVSTPKTISADLPKPFSKENPTGVNAGRRNQVVGDIQHSNLAAVNDAGFDPYGDRPTVDVSTIQRKLDFGNKKPLTLQPEVSANPLEGFENSIPQRSAGELQKLGDYLGNEVRRFDQSKLPGTGDTRYQAYLRSLYGKVKGQLHDLDPDGLGSADAQFHDYAQKAGSLGRLENPDQMEGFINNFYGKNKTLMRESAQDLIPNSVGDIADIGASRAFTRQGPAGSEMGGRRILGSGMGAMLGTHGAMTHNPLEMAAGLASHMITSPGVNKAVIGRSSQAIDAMKAMPWFQAIQKNPALLESISNPSLRSMIQSGLGESSHIPLPAMAGDGSSSDREPAYDPKSPVMSGEEARKRFIDGTGGVQ